MHWVDQLVLVIPLSKENRTTIQLFLFSDENQTNIKMHSLRVTLCSQPPKSLYPASMSYDHDSL